VDDLQSEKEQLEEIRAWWAEYGRYIIAGVVLAVGLLFGYNQLQNSRLEAQVAASALYEELAVEVSEGDLQEAETIANELVTDFANTAYAHQSRLAMARLYMDKNRDEDAAEVLRELVAMHGNSELRQIGRLRLARVLLYQDKPGDVVELLAEQDEPAFNGLYAEALGDAYAALGRVEDAAEAYQRALADVTQTVNRGIVQMKLVDLPEASPEAPPEGGENPVVEPDAEPVVEPDAEPVAEPDSEPVAEPDPDEEAGESE
jgi:predicted negative regulator of RcsB-dependent stress response